MMHIIRTSQASDEEDRGTARRELESVARQLWMLRYARSLRER